MRIFVTGLVSLHWGRLEYGNIGNYYIIAPLFKMLHTTFNDAEIITTFQLTEAFAKNANVTVLPLDYYYAWNDDDLPRALTEYAAAEVFSATGKLPVAGSYIETVLSSDLIIDVSGDMWGDNSKTMGENRFLVGLLKMRTAQLLKKPVVLFASSPGPVTGSSWIELAKKVYSQYALVANREGLSKQIMAEAGFDVSKTYDYACPSFLFDQSYYPCGIDAGALCGETGTIGLVLAAYSLSGRSFDVWERDDDDFTHFAQLVEYIINRKKQRVLLLSHSNGFDPPPDFKRIPWRDHKMQARLYEVIKKRGLTNMDYITLSAQIYDPWEIHTLIGRFDILISGRVHGAVAGLAQHVPTLAIDYKNGPLSHKMRGFFMLAGLEKYVALRDDADFIKYFEDLYENRKQVRVQLEAIIPEIRQKSQESFEALAALFRKED